jgi:hypothetical protein
MAVSQADFSQLRAEIATLRRDLDEMRRQLDTSAVLPDRPDNLAAAEQFAARVSRLPQVQRVLLLPPDDVPRVWTLIKAKPFDDAARLQVYDAELEVLTSLPDARVDFRLINLNEYREDQVEGIIPADAQILWQR